MSAELNRAPTSKRAATRAVLHDHEREILDALSNLSNTVIANEAARSLGRCVNFLYYIGCIPLMFPQRALLDTTYVVTLRCRRP
jgi:hypothetical protein